jgi:hypothetical protein
MKGIRITTRTLLVMPISAALLLIVLNLFTIGLWVGYADVPLEFIILDVETNEPVEGAVLRMTGELPYMPPATGADGRTAIVIHAMCGGECSLLKRTRSVNYSPWDLTIDAEGFEHAREELNRYTRDRKFHDYAAVPPPIVIHIRRRPPQAPSAPIRPATPTTGAWQVIRSQI